MKTNTIILSIILSTVFISTSLAQKQNISVFKNGTAFFVKKEKVNATTGVYQIKEIPQATFGTLWFHAPGNGFKSISSFDEEIAEKKEIKSIPEMLKGSVGKRVKLNTFGEKDYEGIIEQCEDKLLTLKTNDGKWINLEPNSVKYLELYAAPSKEYSQKIKKRIIELNFNKNNASQELEMMYLQKGVSWVPNYSIDLVTDTKAKITLRALLINEVEDLEGASLNFVVGVPNFAYSYLQSPLTSNDALATFINSLNSRSNNYSDHVGRRSDITTQSMANVMLNEPYSGEDEVIEITDLKGQEAEDLFFYNMDNVNLKKGGRAFYDVLQAEVEFQHIYEVSLPTNNSNGYYPREFTKTDENVNHVWHSIRLKNDTKLPWTTGTALITKKIDGLDKPLSQDKLSYVPAGGKGKMKITVAPDISVKDSEREIAREENKKKKDGYNYDLITVEGKVELRNYKDKTIKLNISRNIVGETTKSSEKWNTKKLVMLYNAINPSQEVEWEVDLAAGKTMEITYQYQIYARR